MSLPPITITFHPAKKPAAHELLAGPSSQSSQAEPESQLLKAIRAALQGAPYASQNEIHTFAAGHEELSWNDTRVVLSAGGIIKRHWDFTAEKQPVEYACIGFLEHASPTVNLGNHDYMFPATSKTSKPEKTPFGPFREREKAPGYSEEVSIVPTVFIFLRRIGMAFLENGSRYTFAVPFVVRRAWPIEPYGVMMQRQLDPQELLDASEDDPVLPTIYTLTSPLAEIAPLGLTAGIVASPPLLIDEDERLATTLEGVPPREILVWVSPVDEPYCLAVTVDPETRLLTIWRYVYVKPKIVPQPLPRERIKERARKRQSMAPIDAPALEQFPEFPPLSALPDMPPALTGTVTMQSLMSKEQQFPSFDTTGPQKKRRNSLSDSLDRMKMDDDTSYLPVEHGRMKTAYWAEKLHSMEIPQEDADSWQSLAVSMFDYRWDGKEERCLLTVTLPHQSCTLLFCVATNPADMSLQLSQRRSLPVRSTVALIATRPDVKDLLVVKTDNSLALLSTGIHEIPLVVNGTLVDDAAMHVDGRASSIIASISQCRGVVTADYDNGQSVYTTCSMIPEDRLTLQALQIIAFSLTDEVFAVLHTTFLALWSSRNFRRSDGIEFSCFTEALYRICGMIIPETLNFQQPFHTLISSHSHKRLSSDVSIRKGGLQLPSIILTVLPVLELNDSPSPQTQAIVAPILYALHTLGENLRLTVDRYRDLRDLASVICRLAMLVRPEWADYWRRLSPSSSDSRVWPSFKTANDPSFDDRIPVWPPDISAILYGRISNPDWQVPAFSLGDLAARFAIKPSFAFGRLDPLVELKQLTEVYKALSDPAVSSSIKRAENAVRMMIANDRKILKMLDTMSLGVAAPLREAIRTCQLAPPLDWPPDMYCAIGREDVAASASQKTDILVKDGFLGTKDFMGVNRRRPVTGQLISKVKTLSAGEVGRVTGVELELDDFTDIRFGQDRRLEDVARMLNSSSIQTYKQLNTERPEQPNEIDQNKEYQHQAIRIAEKTIGLAFGRAMFTYGSVSRVHRESYTIPHLNYNIRIHPHNVMVNLEMKLLHAESALWGEFHNGVAAGLRISPSAEGVESSWISFNKPGDLSAAHAGFLFGLGLSGHLKQMVAWNSFQYLTPKHDLTSIGILLGLAAANAGTGNNKVTKLLAVHTPALLPSPTVDLNISLMTQSAGLIGMGLLYIGTKHRRYADMCLKEISRKDLVQANLHNEYRETYTTSAALAFGMIMLGKGAEIPADMEMVDRLNVLIHGEPSLLLGSNLTNKQAKFDLTLTSPAATIAVGLMYLRTERKDIADILTLPDTVLSLNAIQPSFLLIRVIARSLIMWNGITPSLDWLQRQIPQTIRSSIEARVKNGAAVDDSLELAYYNIIAGCCFVVGLKYAGTARQEAYKLIIRYYDLFTRLVYTNGPTFDHRIKRSAVRDGLNLLSVSLSMVMAGTGEITSFRRLRYAYGMFNQTMYHPSHKYGIHVSTYQAIGLLFLGGGRFTLGTSDAAIASMVIAFFPRYHQTSADNKVYLQALRHLWVMAVEPRCLVARDVQTKDVVYLPLKLSVRDGKESGTTQLISPTLIPEIDKITAIRVDTPRYWPFHLDLEKIAQHRESLVRSQTLYVKRRTAFLSYTEDPRGSRSLFVRSRSSAGEAATLDYPQLTDTKTHPASDLSEFITSFSNDPTYLAFADHFAAREDDTDMERLFYNYCHAALYDSILQGKQQSLQSHLTLFMYRNMKMGDPYFHLRLQDLRFAADFYSKIFDRRFSGRSENNPRTPLIRDSTVMAALLSLDHHLDDFRNDPTFLSLLSSYTVGGKVPLEEGDGDKLAWYLLRNGVPVSTLLGILKTLANDAYNQCYPGSPPAGTMDAASLDQGIKEVLHATGTKMTTALGSGWSVRSLDEIVSLWNLREQVQ
ncbi:hypothetical protein BDZ89DRAFT_1010783 [Hymenopellis radicata]|nr:hypothetical protein BDZ89DRAFT_1010783 [Hymenopellis radicata]